jgi:hypothetical protein
MRYTIRATTSEGRSFLLKRLMLPGTYSLTREDAESLCVKLTACGGPGTTLNRTYEVVVAP